MKLPLSTPYQSVATPVSPIVLPAPAPPPNDGQPWRLLAVLLLIAVIGTVVHGCTPARNAATVVSYEDELEHCRQLGLISGLYETYSTCADGVDRRLCAERHLRCKDGGAP